MTRTGRTKEQTIKAYCLFLTILRQKHEQGQEVTNLKPLAEKVHISSSISRHDLPSDLYTAPYEVVTSLDYARIWIEEYLQPLRKERKEKTKQKRETINTQDLGGIFEEQPQTEEIPLWAIMQNIKALTEQYLKEVNYQLSQIIDINTNKLN